MTTESLESLFQKLSINSSQRPFGIEFGKCIDTTKTRDTKTSGLRFVHSLHLLSAICMSDTGDTIDMLYMTL